MKKESYDRPFAWVEIERSELVVLGIERRYIRALMIAFRDAMQVKFGQRFVRAMVPLEPELSARAEAKADAAAIAAEAKRVAAREQKAKAKAKAMAAAAE